MPDLTPPIVALLTPFDAGGKIDWRAFESYLTALSSWGVKSVIANGTTGEFPSLTLAERQEIVEFVKRHFEGTLVNNVSSTCVEDVKNLLAGTERNADAVLLLPPYYYAESSPEGLCSFFEKALSENALPAFLYNFPKHTGNRVDNALIGMLRDKGVQLAGIKDSSGDLPNALAYRSQFPDLKIFFADDAGCLAALQHGLHGSVTGGANPLPEYLLAIQEAFGKPGDKAQILQCAFDVWNAYRTASPLFEIPLVKAAMGARIKDFPIHVRPPFTPAPSEAISRIRTVVLNCLSGLHAILNDL
ncbi:MAG: dihydrodipicolinate synthase family protein [Methylomicrobium sp.]